MDRNNPPVAAAYHECRASAVSEQRRCCYTGRVLAPGLGEAVEIAPRPACVTGEHLADALAQRLRIDLQVRGDVRSAGRSQSARGTPRWINSSGFRFGRAMAGGAFPSRGHHRGLKVSVKQ
jgi:hypothetical protein